MTTTNDLFCYLTAERYGLEYPIWLRAADLMPKRDQWFEVNQKSPSMRSRFIDQCVQQLDRHSMLA